MEFPTPIAHPEPLPFSVEITGLPRVALLLRFPSLPRRQANLVFWHQYQVPGSQIYCNRLLDSLHHACPLRVEVAHQQPPADWLSNTLQARDDCIKNLWTKDKSQLWVYVFDNLLPPPLRIPHSPQRQPTSLGLSKSIAKIEQHST